MRPSVFQVCSIFEPFAIDSERSYYAFATSFSRSGGPAAKPHTWHYELIGDTVIQSVPSLDVSEYVDGVPDRPDSKTPETIAAEAEIAWLVQTAVCGLKSRDRELLMLRYWRKWTFKKIATRFNTCESAVHALHRRTLYRMRISLKLMLYRNYCLVSNSSKTSQRA
jgi:DNA-directed RNA polymerase specialized sigma24 family protein